MQLLTLTTSFPNSENDHRGRFVAEWAQSLRAQGDTVRVLSQPGEYSPTGITRLNYHSPGDLLATDGAPEFMERAPIKALLSGGLTSASMLVRARRVIEPDDLCVAHWLIPSAIAALAAGRRYCNPVHAYVHGSDLALVERLGGSWLARLIDDRVMGITFVSEDLKTRFLRCLDRPARATLSVLPMGITRVEACQAFRRDIRSLAGGRPVIASVGRLVPIKGLDVLAQALAGGPEVLWIAAGDGSERDALESQARQLGVSLYLPGRVSPAQREALLDESQVFVQPSVSLGGRREGTPLAVLEALASGVPVIATSTGGMTGLAESAGVRLIPPGDPGALREALVALLDQPAIRDEMRDAHQRFGQTMSWAQLGPQHRAVLQESQARFRCELP